MATTPAYAVVHGGAVERYEGHDIGGAQARMFALRFREVDAIARHLHRGECGWDGGFERRDSGKKRVAETVHYSHVVDRWYNADREGDALAPGYLLSARHDGQPLGASGIGVSSSLHGSNW